MHQTRPSTGNLPFSLLGDISLKGDTMNPYWTYSTATTNINSSNESQSWAMSELSGSDIEPFGSPRSCHSTKEHQANDRWTSASSPYSTSR